jgi:chromosome segregation ATPase
VSKAKEAVVLSRMSGRVDELQKQLKAAKQEISAKQTEISQREISEVSELEKQLKTLGEERHKYHEEAQHFKAAADAVLSALEATKQDLSAREVEISAVKQELSVREIETSAAKQDLSAREIEISAAQQELSVREIEISAAQQDFSAREIEISAAKQELAAKKIEISAARQVISAKATVCHTDLAAVIQELGALKKAQEASKALTEALRGRNTELEACLERCKMEVLICTYAHIHKRTHVHTYTPVLTHIRYTHIYCEEIYFTQTSSPVSTHI